VWLHRYFIPTYHYNVPGMGMASPVTLLFWHLFNVGSFFRTRDWASRFCSWGENSLSVEAKSPFLWSRRAWTSDDWSSNQSRCCRSSWPKTPSATWRTLFTVSVPAHQRLLARDRPTCKEWVKCSQQHPCLPPSPTTCIIAELRYIAARLAAWVQGVVLRRSSPSPSYCPWGITCTAAGGFGFRVTFS
jgi:hypothetical protein